MPTKRGSRYYIDRSFSGLGRIHRSLATTNKGQASKLEQMLATLYDRGRLDLIRAWLNGKTSLPELADAYESDRLSELTETLEANHCEMRLADAFPAALLEIESDVRESTLIRYKQGIRHFVEFAGKAALVGEFLTTERVQEFKRYRLEQDAARETINNDLGAVSILVTYCIDQGWLSARPKIKRYRTKVRIRYLEADQLRVYMATVRAKFRPLFQLLVGSGMRLGEAESLRVCDLRLGKDESRALIEDSKTPSGRRATFLPRWVAQVLETHVESGGLSGADPLFSIPRRTVQKEHNRACELAGIIDYTIHDHRHTAAVHLARAGLPLQLLQKQLGHATIQQTMRYADFHPDYSDVGRFFERVADGLGLESNYHTSHHTPQIVGPSELTRLPQVATE